MIRRAVALAVFLLLAAAPGASAVWGGAVDTTHPGVGATLLDFDGDGSVSVEEGFCSGSYAGPSIDGAHDVFLTAGHCIPPAEFEFPASQVYVSFDADLTDGVSAPIQVDSYHQMPGFGESRPDPHDLGILLLPAGSAAGLPAVQFPTAGYLDELKATGRLQFTTLDIVGYGVIPDWDTPGQTTFADGGVRRLGTAPAIGLSKAFLRLTQNGGTGTGSGLCFSDSGSPQLLAGTQLVLSVTHGGNLQCNSVVSNYRVDTPAARAFLGEFVTLP
jgi:hypothetical protein